MVGERSVDRVEVVEWNRGLSYFSYERETIVGSIRQAGTTVKEGLW
jgi:hypothetical protein